jgi:hypothetical protein
MKRFASKLCLTIAMVIGTMAPDVGAQPAAAPVSAANAAASKRLLAVASKLQKEQAFDLAADQYEASYGLSPAAETLRQALECYQQSKNSTRVVDTARRLIERHGKELKKPEKDKLQKLIGEAQVNVGQIDLKVSEPASIITIDDREVGRSPLGKVIDIDAGSHKLVVKKEGFEPFEKELTVTAQQTATVEAVMEKEILTAKLVVKEAAGAPVQVVVDGKTVGPAPWEGELPLGPHEVAIKSPKWRADVNKVELVKRKVAEIEIAAVPTVGRIELSTSDNKGLIRIDGRPVGEGSFADDIATGEHVIAVQREGRKSFYRTLTIEAGKTATIAVALEPVGPVAPPDDGRGVLGELMFAGSFQTGERGHQGDVGCDAIGTSCSSNGSKGGGILGVVGYMWNPVGVDFLFGATADVASLQAVQPDGGTSTFGLWRFGPVAALRFRAQVQTKAVRASLALGPTIAERFAGVGKVSTDYAAFGGTGDAQVAVRLSPSTAFAVGFMFWGESSGDNVTVNAPNSTAPFHVASGAQLLLMPHLGLEFGP